MCVENEMNNQLLHNQNHSYFNDKYFRRYIHRTNQAAKKAEVNADDGLQNASLCVSV